ncbi:MAG TPA: class II aldolase/adducin family protein [Stellaceae bacterium]|nr:class II aldolase/adducin family protein [Stellaceae bacterium]
MALPDLLRDLVTANRILAHEGVVDAYGHISVRHPDRPDRFFLSGSRSPELVTLDDIIEYDLDCNPIDLKGRAQYTERPIHGGILRARPDVQAVIHNHAYEVIPFTVAKGVKLRPVLHTSGGIGAELPVWDIREKFGDTNLLVTTLPQGHDLASKLARNQVVLMRGHGSAVTGMSIQDAVSNAIYLRVNAQLLSEAMRFGAEINYLSDGEIAEINRMARSQGGTHARAWEYWSRRAGVTK